MRDIDDMAESEICAATEEDVERIVRLRCARRGIAIGEPHVPAPPAAPSVKQDVVAWCVLGAEFARKEDALRVAEVASGCPVIDLQYNWNESGLLQNTARGEKILAVSVEERRYVSSHAAAGRREEIKRYDEANAAYREALKAREQWAIARDEVAREVRQRIDETRAREVELLRWTQVAEEYLELAQGDGEMAREFFERANQHAMAAFPSLAEVFASGVRPGERPPP